MSKTATQPAQSPVGNLHVLAFWKRGEFVKLATHRQTLTRRPYNLDPADPYDRTICVIVKNLTAAGYTMAFADLGPDGTLHGIDRWMDEHRYVFCGADFGPGLIEH